MSLDSNVVDLATRIGQEIKDVRAEMALVSGGGGASNVIISAIEPDVVVDSLWIEKKADGSFSFWLKEI